MTGACLHRLAVQLFCLWMALYGPPVLALQEVAAERQAQEARQKAEQAERARGEEWAQQQISAFLAEQNRIASTRLAPASAGSASVPPASSDPEPADVPPAAHSAISSAVAASVFGVQEEKARPTPPSPPSFVGSQTPGAPTGPTTLTKADLDSIPFLPSWNLISIPETPTVSTPSDVFASIDGSYSTVWFYDACDPSAEKWKVYDPSNPGGSTLSTLSPTQGLWLGATAAGSLPSTGELPATTSWQLCTGWNLIGFPASQNRHIKTALQTIRGKYSMVYGYDPSDAEDPWAIHDVTVPDWANDLQVFEVGKGYWILVNEDVTLEIPNQGDAPTVAFTHRSISQKSPSPRTSWAQCRARCSTSGECRAD